MSQSKPTKCGFDGCNRTRKCKGLCDTHYSQQRRGKPLTPIRIWPSVDERFWAKVEKTNTCWRWIGHTNGFGYGLFKAHRRQYVAHRFSYELLVGPIPEGKVLDHTCFNKDCVNPSHVVVVTQSQNSENRRGSNNNSKSGVRGVSWDSTIGKWRSQAGVTINGKRKSYHAGYFDSIEEAAAAAIDLRNELFTNNLLDRKAV